MKKQQSNKTTEYTLTSGDILKILRNFKSAINHYKEAQSIILEQSEKNKCIPASVINMYNEKERMASNKMLLVVEFMEKLFVQKK